MNHEEPDHDDGGPAGAPLRIPLVLVLRNEDGDDNMARGHADSADGQDRLTPDAVDPKHGGDREDEHDNADDAGGKQSGRCGSQSELVENRGSIVEDRVDTGPLLCEVSKDPSETGERGPYLEEHGDAGDHNALEQRLRFE